MRLLGDHRIFINRQRPVKAVIAEPFGDKNTPCNILERQIKTRTGQMVNTGPVACGLSIGQLRNIDHVDDRIFGCLLGQRYEQHLLPAIIGANGRLGRLAVH